MSGVDITIEVCGTAGDGTIAAGGLLNQAMSVAGFSVLGFDSYPAEIRGFGRCVTRSRIGTREILALEDTTNVLISLDDYQSRSRIPFLAKDGAVFFDDNPPTYVREEDSLTGLLEPGTIFCGLPITDLAVEASGGDRGKNLTALGGFAGAFRLDPEPFRTVISNKFRSKGDKVVESNLACFQAGYEFGSKNLSELIERDIIAPEAGEAPEKVMLSGNLAIGRGAIDAGLKLYFGYPITPATPIMEYLAAKLPDLGGKVTQMEDEISSIAAVLGAMYAGKRAMTATSGPGFALMTELIGYGVMAEIPAVILNAQRGGPSTGLPTKTEQSDLQAAVFGGPGDACRVVIAPTDVAECYHFTASAFRLAETYQCPVVVLTDFFLDNRVENLPMPRISEKDQEEVNLYPDESDKGKYKRYKLTESGISPRSIPGMEGFQYTGTGLEHTEAGTPDYSAETHTLMSEKRHHKLEVALTDLPEPAVFADEGPLDVGVIAWGSTFGACLEAVDIAREQGYKVGALKVVSIFPFHEDAIRDFMNRCEEILIPELNFQGQLANLIGRLHRKEVKRLNRATGVPIAPSLILQEIEALTKEGPK